MKNKLNRKKPFIFLMTTLPTPFFGFIGYCLGTGPNPQFSLLEYLLGFILISLVFGYFVGVSLFYLGKYIYPNDFFE